MPQRSYARPCAAKTLDDYRCERLLRQAIERKFEIIGEAVNRLAQHDSDTAGRISKYRQIVAFRNVLTHGYDLIDDRLVWSTIDEEVPVLLTEVEALLIGPRRLWLEIARDRPQAGWRIRGAERRAPFAQEFGRAPAAAASGSAPGTGLRRFGGN